MNTPNRAADVGAAEGSPSDEPAKRQPGRTGRHTLSAATYFEGLSPASGVDSVLVSLRRLSTR